MNQEDIAISTQDLNSKIFNTFKYLDKQTRYLVAFVITAFVYAVSILAFWNLTGGLKLKDENLTEQSSVKIYVLSLPVQTNSKINNTIKSQTSKQTEQNSQQNNQIINQQLTQSKPNKIESPTIENQKQIEQKVEAKTEAKEQKESTKVPQINKEDSQQIKQTQVIQQKSIQQVANQPAKENYDTQNNPEMTSKRNAYFALIKQTIEKQKYYPKNALRRGIEADMVVKFTITPFGDLVNVSIVDGNRAFESSLIEAIEATFPLTPPKNILHSNTTLTLMVSYKIRD